MKTTKPITTPAGYKVLDDGKNYITEMVHSYVVYRYKRRGYNLLLRNEETIRMFESGNISGLLHKIPHPMPGQV